MTKTEYTIWLIPWILWILSCFGLALVLSELVVVWATGKHWLSASLVGRMGWMCGVYFIFFAITRIGKYYLFDREVKE
ncbi:hypothetical protein LCGC14_0627830 [marine sediment metagenome]|uniref:Uncharacterized protein n=1 Tax=marine sediment metagenome TaxID=412755 RepID=A0A0F9UBC8_9ZZZZ